MRNYRIYWNLRKRCWSVLTRTDRGWRLMTHHVGLVAYNAEFVVREAGRQRVLTDRRKNVHAYVEAEVVCADPAAFGEWYDANEATTLVTYNPYRSATFHVAGDVTRPVDWAYSALMLPHAAVHVPADTRVCTA